MHSNEGAARLISAIRDQARKVGSVQIKNNTLGTVTSKGIYIDSIEDEIPKSDFLFLKTEEELKNGDRVLCIPVGDYYVVAGKVV